MAVVTLDCPFCMAAHVAFTFDAPFSSKPNINVSGKPEYAAVEARAIFGRCGSGLIVYFRSANNSDSETVADDSGRSMVPLGSLPNMPKASAPKHLPPNVAKSFLGAEKARIASLWTEAAASFGKAVDRGISPLLPEDGKRRTLGQKLSWLKDNGSLADPLADWIGVILKDRNFATHDEDHDFESAEEIEPIRNLARILLTYLYTLPKEVEIARGDNGD